MSLGIIKPMADGLDLIAWITDSASEVDTEIVLHISANTRSDLHSLPSSIRLVGWIPMGVSLNGADGFIHHGGAGNTLTTLYAGTPQITFGQGADRPINAHVVAGRGYEVIPGDVGLSSNVIDTFLNNRSLRKASEEVAVEMMAQPCPGEVAKSPTTIV